MSRAMALGVYFSALAASYTRRRVSSRTCSGAEKARDTVAVDTPESFDTS